MTKTRIFDRLGGGVAATVLLASLLIPVSASASEAPEPPPSDGSTVFVDPSLEGTTVSRDSIQAVTPRVSAEVQARLRDRGLVGPLLSVQEGANGLGTFYAGKDSWLLDLAPNSLSEDGITTQAFGYGFCTGYFNTPKKVSNYLQWGGQSSCTTSNGQYYLHQVKAALYDTCIGPFCAILTYRATATSPSSSNYSRVATASGALFCVNNSGRTYEQKITVTVRSVSYGPFWQRGIVISNCSVAP